MSVCLFPKPPLEPYSFIHGACTASLALGGQQGTAKRLPTRMAGKTKAVLGRTSRVEVVANDGEGGGVVREGFSEEVTSEKNPE